MPRTSYGTFDELLEITEEPLRPIAAALRRAVLEVDPGSTEVVRLGDRAATYGLGPRKMIDGYAFILPHKRWVNLGFYHAVELPDPEGLLEGSGVSIRHVKIRSLEDAGRSAVRDLIKIALSQKRAARR